jgi:Transposase DDE domain
MFARIKKSGNYQYVQVVHNERIQGRVRQRVIATLGRLDVLKETGQLDQLLESLARLSDHVAILNAMKAHQITPSSTVHLGPPLVFGKLWKQLGMADILRRLLEGRRFEFPLERVVFITVLHRLFVSGSDRAAERWCRKYALEDLGNLDLQHFYRTMGWLGEPLPVDQQPADPLLGPRLRKDLIEEALFQRRRDLFSGLRLVFIDTTSLYFEGQGGETIGQRGYSKDHRPDLKQMILVAVMDDEGRPVCCELLPGNTADIQTLLPVVDRLRERFDIRDVCVVADRGMISEATIAELSARGIHYILGARLRNVKEIRETVLSRGGRYCQVHGPRQHGKSPSPLKVKQVFVEDRRYIVCHNEEQAHKDQADRKAILEKLSGQLKQGGTSLVGNKGYRKYLSAAKGGAFQIDEAKVKRDERFDGKWVLRTDTDLPAEDVALRYKDLLLVEDTFRMAKSILETRPIFHQCDDTIRGHVFCSFLALVLLKELQALLELRGWRVEWERLRDDLDELQELTLPLGEMTFVIRTPPVGEAVRAIQAVGVALGPSVRLAD